jgi:Domain of unknown function in PX-proteins (DUF3818)
MLVVLNQFALFFNCTNHDGNQVDAEMKAGAQLFAYMKQLLKLYTRQRDKAMMLSIIEEVDDIQSFFWYI